MKSLGAISDSSSLRKGLQITWIFLLISGVVWYLGYVYLPPLEIDKDSSNQTASYSDIFRPEIKATTAGPTASSFEMPKVENSEQFNPLTRRTRTPF